MIDRYHSNEYYSGAQVRVYFGHLLIDEIASIEWAGTSTKRPVYGYASTVFDAVAQGQYLCQGAFLMPFKEVGFLYAVQRSLSDQGVASSRIIEAIKSQNKQPQSVTVIPTPGVGGLSPRVRVTTTAGTSPEGTNRVQEIVTAFTPADLLENVATQGGQPFNDLVESLQSTIWDTPTGTAEPIIRPDEFDLDQTTGFVQRGFNILVTFGDVNNPKQSSTVKSLIDVHLTGDQRVIATDGNPIFERYTFFCRATDETLGQYRIIPDRVSATPTDASAPQQPTTTPRKAQEGSLPEVTIEAEREKTEVRKVATRSLQPQPAPVAPSRSSSTRRNVTSADTRHLTIRVLGVDVSLSNITTYVSPQRGIVTTMPRAAPTNAISSAYSSIPAPLDTAVTIARYAYDQFGQLWFYDSITGQWFSSRFFVSD